MLKVLRSGQWFGIFFCHCGRKDRTGLPTVANLSTVLLLLYLYDFGRYVVKSVCISYVKVK